MCFTGCNKSKRHHITSHFWYYDIKNFIACIIVSKLNAQVLKEKLGYHIIENRNNLLKKHKEYLLACPRMKSIRSFVEGIHCKIAAAVCFPNILRYAPAKSLCKNWFQCYVSRDVTSERDSSRITFESDIQGLYLCWYLNICIVCNA